MQIDLQTLWYLTVGTLLVSASFSFGKGRPIPVAQASSVFWLRHSSRSLSAACLQ